MADALQLVDGEAKDIGDFEVYRVLPSAKRRSVGPFVFWDHFGPVSLPAGRNMDVRPHPHIGLATVTWLFEGQITHRDSLGHVQDITPGAVNWMTAGKGIVHSERTPAARRGQANPLHGLQIWLALPDDHEEAEPAFHHHPPGSLPGVEHDGIHFDLIAGAALGHESPVQVFSPLCYLAVQLAAGQRFNWPRHYSEEAVYVVEGSVEVGGTRVRPHQMAVLPADGPTVVSSAKGATLAILGGEPLGRRFVWWNFVASERAMIKAAARRWADGGFTAVPGDDEFIPLPEDRPMP
jgi:redox-sensitive bicupin YhaK (pirin superfamily)